MTEIEIGSRVKWNERGLARKCHQRKQRRLAENIEGIVQEIRHWDDAEPSVRVWFPDQGYEAVARLSDLDVVPEAADGQHDK